MRDKNSYRSAMKNNLRAFRKAKPTKISWKQTWDGFRQIARGRTVNPLRKDAGKPK